MAVKKKKTVKKIKKTTREPQPELIRQELAPAPEAQKKRAGSLITAIVTLAVIATVAFFFSSPSLWKPELSIKKSIDKAEKSSVYRNYKRAVSIYEKLIAKWGNNEKYAEYIKQARLNLAKTYQDSGEYLKAVALYKELCEEYKDVNADMHAWLLLELGESYAGLFNTSEAIKTYQGIVEKFKGTDWAAEALFGIADAYKASGDSDNALKYYNIIVNKYEKGFLSAEALTNIGQIYEREGRPAKALEVYARIIKEFPDVVTEYAKIRYDSLASKIKK
jgi:tetratricopeptide (TPR) repeat protein